MFQQLSEPEMMALMVRGRALVRVIEAGTVLLAYHLDSHERVVFGLAVEAAQAQLHELIGEIDPAILAQIIIASENVLGTVVDVTVN